MCVSKDDIESIFPNLIIDGYEITSPEAPDYNCIAYSVGDCSRWWWPDQFGICYWPQNSSRKESVEAFLEVYNSLGFVECDSPEPQPGFEKIALFVGENGKPTHAAKLLPSGHWCSKLGKIEDITHSLKGIEGSDYGKVKIILKRKIHK